MIKDRPKGTTQVYYSNNRFLDIPHRYDNQQYDKFSAFFDMKSVEELLPRTSGSS
jgi:hypothetical protein